jgi:hypothetical protein
MINESTTMYSAVISIMSERDRGGQHDYEARLTCLNPLGNGSVNNGYS